MRNPDSFQLVFVLRDHIDERFSSLINHVYFLITEIFLLAYDSTYIILCIVHVLKIRPFSLFKGTVVADKTIWFVLAFWGFSIQNVKEVGIRIFITRYNKKQVVFQLNMKNLAFVLKFTDDFLPFQIIYFYSLVFTAMKNVSIPIKRVRSC